MTNFTLQWSYGAYLAGSGPLAVSRMTEIEAAVDSLNTAHSTAHNLTLVTPDEFDAPAEPEPDGDPHQSIGLGLGLNF